MLLFIFVRTNVRNILHIQSSLHTILNLTANFRLKIGSRNEFKWANNKAVEQKVKNAIDFVAPGRLSL